jgi:peptide/nickel transport system permease protein
MIRYVIRRLLWAVVLFIAVTIVTYIIFFIIPADPARAVAGKTPRPR